MLPLPSDSVKAALLENHGYCSHDPLPTWTLLTVGEIVTKATYRHATMERTCQAQSPAEAAAANGIKKNIIRLEDNKHNADALQEPSL